MEREDLFAPVPTSSPEALVALESLGRLVDSEEWQRNPTYWQEPKDIIEGLFITGFTPTEIASMTASDSTQIQQACEANIEFSREQRLLLEEVGHTVKALLRPTGDIFVVTKFFREKKAELNERSIIESLSLAADLEERIEIQRIVFDWAAKLYNERNPL